MEMLNIEFWGVALDIAALTLCGITVLYIAGRKRYGKKETALLPSEKSIERIVQKTFNHLIHQNGGKSFRQMAGPVRIETAVTGDRHFVVGGERTKSNIPAGQPRMFGNGLTALRDVPYPGKRDVASLKIFKFKESGMSVDKISEKLEMPRCEVELITKFRPHTADFSGLRNGRV